MPVSSGGSGVPGNQARQLSIQADAYFVRGGPNDPVLQTTPVVPATPSGGGSLSWNSQVTIGPVPGQTANRTMGLHSAGTLTGGQLTGNTGGIFIGTIPQGAWLIDMQLMCYTGLGGGTDLSVGLFYALNSTSLVYPVPTLNLLAYITSPATGTMYGVKTTLGQTLFTAANAAPGPTGPGNPVAGIAQLASLGDIDIYLASFLIAGGGTANTAGCYAAWIDYTGGLEG